jgi:hypothetical protein
MILSEPTLWRKFHDVLVHVRMYSMDRLLPLETPTDSDDDDPVKEEKAEAEAATRARRIVAKEDFMVSTNAYC